MDSQIDNSGRGLPSLAADNDASPLQANGAARPGTSDAVSPIGTGDIDASRRSPGDAAAVCDWCRLPLDDARPGQRFCSKRCRQSAFRLRRQHQVKAHEDKPLRVAYADPPYPGMAKLIYADEPTYAGEVDHAALIASLTTSYDGWALSTGAYALRELLPLCPPAARVCAWVKPIGASGRTLGMHNAWEPLIVMPARRLRPGKRDWLRAMPARGGGTLLGRKPLAFCAWLFELLGMLPGDDFADLFPGTGVVSRAWDEVCRHAVARAGLGDASFVGPADAASLIDR